MSDVIKSGWLHREDGILWKSWSKRYSQLTRDGLFRTFKNETTKTPEEIINMRTDLKKINTGFEVGATNLPKGRSDTESLFELVTKHKRYLFLGATQMDCFEWTGMLKNAKETVLVQAAVPDAPPAHNGTSNPHYWPQNPNVGYVPQPYQEINYASAPQPQPYHGPNYPPAPQPHHGISYPYAAQPQPQHGPNYPLAPESRH